MPVRPSRVCKVGTCPFPAVTRGRCVQHVGPDPSAVYRLAKWRRLRLQILSAEPFCRDCRDRLAVEVHHIQHRDAAPERFYDPTNLAPLCGTCHQRRTSRGE
jgi:5-methylcytosine-specific restriction endonuclease McrA